MGPDTFITATAEEPEMARLRLDFQGGERST